MIKFTLTSMISILIMTSIIVTLTLIMTNTTNILMRYDFKVKDVPLPEQLIKFILTSMILILTLIMTTSSRP